MPVLGVLKVLCYREFAKTQAKISVAGQRIDVLRHLSQGRLLLQVNFYGLLPFPSLATSPRISQ